MPPVIFAAVIGAGLYAGYKLFTKLIEQAQTPPRSDSRTPAPRGDGRCR